MCRESLSRNPFEAKDVLFYPDGQFYFLKCPPRRIECDCGRMLLYNDPLSQILPDNVEVMALY
jgi:hypothetical protein